MSELPIIFFIPREDIKNTGGEKYHISSNRLGGQKQVGDYFDQIGEVPRGLSPRGFFPQLIPT